MQEKLADGKFSVYPGAYLKNQQKAFFRHAPGYKKPPHRLINP